MNPFPDAICALAVAACFVEGTVYLEDAAVCRRKETDRIKTLHAELSKLGADVEEKDDALIIHGHSPVTAEGKRNPQFSIHGGTVQSYDDHRLAMSFACLGLGLAEGESLEVTDAECCAVSFPGFFDAMNSLGAGFKDTSL